MIQVFTRRVGENPFIGDAIEVIVLSVRDGEVRFAIARRHSGRAEVRVFNAHVRESLVTDDEIEVIVLSVRDGEVRVEIVAPKSVSVQAKKTHGRNHSGRIA